jgi:hypothetical protein
MAAMASLAPMALQTLCKLLLNREGLSRENGASGVQLQRNSEFSECKVAAPVRGRERERRAAEFGGAVRGFSLPGGDDSAAVEGLPGNQEVPNLFVMSHAVEMKKGYGAFGGGGATLEKSKLDLLQSTARVKQEVNRGNSFLPLMMNLWQFLLSEGGNMVVRVIQAWRL